MENINKGIKWNKFLIEFYCQDEEKKRYPVAHFPGFYPVIEIFLLLSRINSSEHFRTQTLFLDPFYRRKRWAAKSKHISIAWKMRIWSPIGHVCFLLLCWLGCYDNARHCEIILCISSYFTNHNEGSNSCMLCNIQPYRPLPHSLIEKNRVLSQDLWWFS